MAKDPAFLFYSADFITGTQFFTDEQVGKYMRLLCAQHLHGHLQEKHMINICQTYDEDIFSKFEKDEEGLYFNRVLEGHINKRKDYAESRRNNRLKAFTANNSTVKPADIKKVKGKKDMIDISSSYDQHMENVIVNENVIINKEDKIKKAQEKLKKEIAEFIEEAHQFDDDYGIDMINEFINHWTEYDEKALVTKWQINKKKNGTFVIKNRLVTWSNNNSKGFIRTGSVKPSGEKPAVSKVEEATKRHNDLLDGYE